MKTAELQQLGLLHQIKRENLIWPDYLNLHALQSKFK